jgi:hypothetical protein
MNDQAGGGAPAAETAGGDAPAQSAKEEHFNLVVGKATDKLEWWQQVPAWVLGLAAIVGAGCLIGLGRHLTDAQSRDAWAAVIVALFLAVLLSYRSACTLNAKNGGAAGDAPKDKGGAGDTTEDEGGAEPQGRTAPAPPGAAQPGANPPTPENG